MISINSMLLRVSRLTPQVTRAPRSWVRYGRGARLRPRCVATRWIVYPVPCSSNNFNSSIHLHRSGCICTGQWGQKATDGDVAAARLPVCCLTFEFKRRWSITKGSKKKPSLSRSARTSPCTCFAALESASSTEFSTSARRIITTCLGAPGSPRRNSAAS